jgi:uncharacterized protein
MQRLTLVLVFLGLACVCGRSIAAFDEELHAAIRADDVEAIRSKLAKGVDLEPVCRPNFNCKPLVYAAFLGRRQIVEMLVDAGADLNGTSAVGDTALIKALLLSDRPLGRELAKYLIAKGADVNKPNVFGISAFIGACGVGDLEMINLMLARGAMIDSAFAYQISLRTPGATDRNTCLHLAIKEGHLEAARLILRAGADPKIRNSAGKLPVFYAEQAGRRDLVDLLSSYAP